MEEDNSIFSEGSGVYNIGPDNERDWGPSGPSGSLWQEPAAVHSFFGYPSGTPMGISQGDSGPPAAAPRGNASWYAASRDAWHAAVFGPIDAAQTIVPTASHTYAVNSAQAITAAEAAAARAHPNAPQVHGHRATAWGPSISSGMYSEARLEPSDQSIDGAAPLAFPSLHSPMKPGATEGHDDFTASVEHEWLNTMGIRGPLSVPVAVVVPVDHDNFGPEIYKPDFANILDELSGLTFRTPGMLFDTGAMHTSFANPLVF